jgi:hypothetical protein
MNPLSLPKGLAAFLPSGALGWSHGQRLAERWLRLWGYALSAGVLGLSGMWLARPEVNEAHETAVHKVAQLTQQLAEMPAFNAASPPANALALNDQPMTDAQRLWQGLPAWSPPEIVWAAWQQALLAHGLRLQFLQPMPTSSSEGHSVRLTSHVAAWRALGRFDDWARVWSACAESGPVCAIERINVVATEQADVVQIDAVTRMWMHPSKAKAADPVQNNAVQGQAPGWGEGLQAHAWAQGRPGLAPLGRSRVALFVPSQSGMALASDPSMGVAEGLSPSAKSEGASAGAVTAAALPDDPKQWPLSRIRLAGLWQQGSERQAVLSAGTHWAKVRTGQRVTLEGHRVVAITDEGVRLRLGTGPWLQLGWAQDLEVGGSAGPETSQSAGSFKPTHTTGRHAK